MTDSAALSPAGRIGSSASPADPADPNTWRPRWRALAALALAALAIRLLFMIAGCLVFDLTPEQYANRGDGISYIRYARFIASQPTEFTAYDTRVFPGYPLLIAPLSLMGMPTWLAALALNMAAGTTAAVLSAAVFRDLRVGWLMAFFTPVFVAASSIVGNESPMLAFTLAGLLVARRAGITAAGVGGLLVGLGGVQRPMACFALLGWMVVLFRRRQFGAALVMGVAAAAVVGATLAGVQYWFGDALHGVRFYATSDQSYAGELLTWPMKSLIFTPFYQPVQMFKIPYIWAHVLLTFAGIALLAWQIRAGWGDDRRLLAVIWLSLNTLYVLMIGSDWGFHALPRFLIPGLPPLFYAISTVLPPLKNRLALAIWVVAVAASFAVGLYHVRAT